MKQPKITDFLSGEITYDNEGQYFWNTTHDGRIDMVAELRGWGHIQNMFKNKKGSHIDVREAGIFQDEIGQFIADAINEKLERLKGGI